MRIVSLNTWKNEGDYPQRLALMAGGLRDLDADLICLQECFAGGNADTAAGLARELGMQVTAAPARRKLRPHDGRPILSTSGLAVLSRTRPLRQASLRLKSDPRDGERIALRLDLADQPSLRVLNLHLTHLRGAFAAELRAAQLVQALAWAQDDWPGALVVCGDLNAARGAPELAPLQAVMGDELGPTLHGGRDGGPPPTGEAIDHCVLLQPGRLRVRHRLLALQGADSEGRRPSDHAAVAVDLEPA